MRARFCDCSGEHYGCNPNRWNIKTKELSTWYRCWECGGLWDEEGNDVLALDGRLKLDEKELHG